LAPALAGAQTLLTLKPARQNYLAEALAVGLYALILAGALTYTTHPQEAPAEEPMELVMEPVAPPPPPPEPEVKPPPPEELAPPPPPEAVAPPVAPVEPPKPKPIPRVEPKPKPKPVPKVERAIPVAPKPVPPGATVSAIGNQIHMRLARAAANAYPESQKPRSARITYRVLLDASGHVTSYTISPSGNAAFDGVAQRLGGRIGTVDAPGKPAAFSGVLVFAYQ
jgi:type IV secretory pathway VirB10-like protein